MTKLIDRLSYDPETGLFRWKVSSGTRKAGSVAGSKTQHGYILIAGKYAHRLAWEIVHGGAPTEVDHINNNRSDNRLCNLREVSRSLNNRNRKTVGKSGARGVWRNGSGWAALIGSGKLRKYLGTFRTKEAAAAAYSAAKARSENEALSYWDSATSVRVQRQGSDSDC